MKKFAAFSWNIIGSTCYSVTSFFYLIIVTRICGVEMGGFFSLSYATAQLLLAVGRYGVRTYQATDLNSQYSFYEYIASRIITVFAMVFLGFIYSVISFDGAYAVMSVLIIVMKSLDAIEDVYHGRMQQVNHIEEMGKSQAFRNMYTLICFTVTLILTCDLQISLAITVLTSFFFCIVVNNHIIKTHLKTGDDQRYLEFKSVFKLLYLCSGIFVGTFLSLFIYNIPKYAMAQFMSIEYQTYYSILFMPTFVITLLCEFIFKPTITSIADRWNANKNDEFKSIVLFNYGIILIFSVIVLFGGHFVGRHILEILYGVDLSPYKKDFIILLLGGSVSSFVYFTYNILIAIRFEKSIKTTYGLVAIICVLIINPLIKGFGMTGATINYLISQLLLLIIFLGTFLKIYFKNKTS